MVIRNFPQRNRFLAPSFSPFPLLPRGTFSRRFPWQCPQAKKNGWCEGVIQSWSELLTWSRKIRYRDGLILLFFFRSNTGEVIIEVVMKTMI